MLSILPPVLQQIRLLQVEPLSNKYNKCKKFQDKLLSFSLYKSDFLYFLCYLHF